jgi:hypothetical protein
MTSTASAATPFSASDAALEGFGLIRRRWRVLLGWAGFNLLSLVMLVVLTVMLSLVASAASGGGSGPAEVVAAVVVLFGSLALQAILAAGVFRLELRPEEPAFLHLRLGRDELRLLVVWLLTIAGAWVVGWAVALAAHAANVAEAWTSLVAAVVGLYLGLRFLLTAPASFAERRIDFVRSWRLTRGRVAALLGMTALSLFLIALIVVLVFVVLGLVAVGSAGFEGLAGLFGGTEALKAHPGVYLLVSAVELVLVPVLWVLALAPLAAAYRAFTATEAAAS